ncbi:hypothetical protein K431DRAFT_301940 [Polychaeton citri CBS 116435]|uniref:Sulfotransferase domain-containing protein n=1 Tax=Polychaeton citri CBS 116435 TaxID=1314669 RepID=A0A9P4QCU5_9PEZI|nr:hypothetical protein K431DRAFT_301940 [Polychaeton citri CBS 116435]
MTSQIVLFAQSRSGSHLLERMISKQQPDVKPLYNPLGPSRGIQLGWLRSETFADGMQQDKMSEFEASTHDAVAEWEGELSRAPSEGRKLIIHTHPFNPAKPSRMLHYVKLLETRPQPPLPPEGENFTLLPDTLLLREGTVPIINIRDPRLVVPSAYRVLDSFGLPHGGGRPNFLIATCPIWARLLYDWYISHGVHPLVADADDFMTSEDFVRRICSRAGLDPALACFAWEELTPDEKAKLHPMYYKSQKTLVDSCRVRVELAGRNLNLEELKGEWEEKFGEDMRLVREMVDLSVPHYEYLYERRMKL